MSVEIEYCVACGYRRYAEMIADTLRVARGCDVRLVPGGDGAFEVRADGRLIFSHREAQRFPSDNELISALDS